jgi:adenosylcobinamide-GDP ribazoletransferase
MVLIRPLRVLRDSFCSAWTLTTRVGLPSWFRFSTSYNSIGLGLPLVGLVLTVVVWVLFIGVGYISPVLAVLLGLFVQYVISNLFHFDGLLDTADGFLGAANHEKTMEILKDPRIGVYGLFVGVSYLVAKGIFLYGLVSEVISSGSLLPIHGEAIRFDLLTLMLYPVYGRICGGLVPCWCHAASTKGLGSLLIPYKKAYSLVVSTLFIAGFFGVMIFFDIRWIVMLSILGIGIVSTFGISFWISKFYTKRIGGFTGDGIGAAIELGEIAVLVFGYLLIQLGMI